MDAIEKYITIEKNSMGGMPVFKGTQVTIQKFFDCLKDTSLEDFLKGHPTVNKVQAEAIIDSVGAKIMESSMAHFHDIRNKIINVLSSAKSSIRIAMCFFTNKEIASTILAKRDCTIQLLISDNFINRSYSRFNYQNLIDAGCEIYLSSEDRLMHNKFCIVDDKIVITGSYNWTDNAENNFGNVLITDQIHLVNLYKENFNYLILNNVPITEFEKIAVGNDESLIPLLSESKPLICPPQIVQEKGSVGTGTHIQQSGGFFTADDSSIYSKPQIGLSRIWVEFDGNYRELRLNEEFPDHSEVIFLINFENQDRVSFHFCKDCFNSGKKIVERRLFKNRFSSLYVNVKFKLEDKCVRIFSSEEGSVERELDTVWLHQL